MKKKVLAICGSTRQQSSNLSLIKAIQLLTIEDIEISIYPSITDLPHYNPELDNDQPPNTVIQFRQLLKAADGVLICTPEYAMGLPGSMKNLLDWTVSSSDFSNKPVLAITAASSGQKAHASLIETLTVIEARVEGTELLISFIKTKLNDRFEIADTATLLKVKEKLDAFQLKMHEP